MLDQLKKYTWCWAMLCLFAYGAFSQTDSSKVVEAIQKARDFEQENADSALFYSLEAYKQSQHNSSLHLKGKAALQVGVAYYNMGDYKKAALYYQEGIVLSEKSNNKKLQAQAYNGFANLFATQKQFSQASEYFHKALDISKELEDTRKVSVILMNLANIEYNKAYYSNDFTQCNKAYNEAYNWAVMAKDTDQIISCLGNWGMSYSDEGKFELSLEKLNTAISLAENSKNKADLVFLKYYLGRTYGIMHKHQLAITAFDQSLKLAMEFKDVDFQSENYLCLAESNYELGNYKVAYDFFKQYKNTEDTIASKELAAELNTIKAQYDTEKKQKQIELLEAKAGQDKMVKASLMIGAVMLLVLAFLMFNRYRLKAKTNKLLEHQNAIISEKNKDISDSINYAKKIQEAIFPSHEDIGHVFPEFFILSLPKDVVSGDFYWFTKIDNLKIFAVADCTGHGVPGAFMSMIGNTLLNHIVIERKIVRPDLILNELRKEIIKALKQGETSQSKDGMDISLICLNTDTKLLQVACANNPVWILKSDHTFSEIKPDKQPIGYAADKHNDFTLQESTLSAGDIIFQFTDGFADQFGGTKGKKFKYNPFQQTLLSIQQYPIKEQGDALKAIFADWKGNLQQVDDVLVSGIKV